MHGPMRPVSTPGLPPRLLLLLLVLLASPFAVANSLKKLADSLNDDMERYALLMLDPAGGADTLPSIALPRRITAKSVFIAPSARPKCEDGYERDSSGTCVRRINVDPDNAWSFFVGKLNDKFGSLDPVPQTPADAQAAAEAVEAVAVATQVAAEASPPALEPLLFHIPIESEPEVTTTEAAVTETTTVPTTTETVQDETVTPPATTPAGDRESSYEPEVILVDGDKSPSIPLSMAPVVVPELEVATDLSTAAPTTRPPPTVYAVKSDDVEADPIINSVSDSPLLASLKKFAPIVVAELPGNFPSPSPSAAAAAMPLDASAVPPRRRPSSFVRFPGTQSPSSSSSRIVFPKDDDQPSRTVHFPSHAGDSHAENSHTGNRHAENSHAGNRHAENSHTGNRHSENSHAGNRHAENSHAGSRYAENSHAGNRHAGSNLSGSSHAGSSGRRRYNLERTR